MDYSKLKRHYELNDYVGMPYTAVQDYYPIGAMAVISNPNIFDITKGWSLYAHGQPAAPLFFGFIPWPARGPGFEAKRIQFRSSTSALVRFCGIGNVQHLIPPSPPLNNPMVFFQRTWIVFVQAVATVGVLDIWSEG